MSTISAIITINQQLEALKNDAKVVAVNLVKTNRQFYRHLAEIYLWWREANETEGYLQEQYAALNKRLKSKVKSGINFAPLFWLIWGSYNGLTDDKVRRWTRVLNVLHNLYDTQAQYCTDTVAKFVNYIECNGGVDGLVNGTGDEDKEGSGGQAEYEVSGSDDMGDEEIEESSQYIKAVASVPVESIAEVFEVASKHYTGKNLPKVTISGPIPLSEDGLATLVVRKLVSGYEVIGKSIDFPAVQQVVAKTYQGDFSVLQPTIRAILETLATQCLPMHLQKFYKRLEDNSATSKKSKAVRRLMYRHETGELILSPIRASSGVITTAKLKHNPFENAQRDCYMSTATRRALELKLLSKRTLNSYKLNSDQLIAEHSRDYSFSHVAQLTDMSKNRRINLEFGNFLLSTKDPKQLIWYAYHAPTEGVQVVLDASWCGDFANSFTKKWLESHGRHITRDHQRVFRLKMDQYGLTVGFVQRNGDFDINLTFPFPKPTRGAAGIDAFVLSKDFSVVMQALAETVFNDDVTLEMNSDLLLISYSTDAADYRICIPTCTEYGQRNNCGLREYEPALQIPDPHENFDDQVEGDQANQE